MTKIIMGDGKKIEVVKDAKIVTLSSKPNTEELRKEVEAMMRSFQPVSEQPVIVQPVTANGNGHFVDTNGSSSTSIISNDIPVTSAPLPAFVLSAVANATAASIAAKNQNSSSSTLTTSSSSSVPVVIARGSNSSSNIVPSASAMPIPIEVIANGGGNGATNGGIVNVINAQQLQNNQQSLPTTIIVRTSSGNVIDPQDILWNGNQSSATTLTNTTTTSTPTIIATSDSQEGVSNGAPAVVVEAAHTVPVTFIECDPSSLGNLTGANGVSLENIDYDYLYPTTSNVTTEVRQLDFCML